MALVGHRGSGKTSLHEALLFEAGATNRLGTVADGTTVSDSDEDEQAREMSISAALASFEWRGRQDQPDRHARRALLRRRRARRAARVRVGRLRRQRRDGRRGLAPQRLWERAAELGVARLVFVNMLDRERADFFRTLESLKAAFGPHVVATEIPIGSEHEVRGVIDLVDMKAYEYAGAGRENCKEIPIPDDMADAGPGVPREADGRGRRELRRADGALPRGRGDLARGDRHRARGRHRPRPHLPGHLRRRDPAPGRRPPARRDRRRPALAGPARRARARGHDARGRTPTARRSPTSSRRAPTRSPAASTSSASTRARCSADSHVLNTRAHAKERIGQLLVPQGKEVSHADAFGPGDIGAVAKLKETRAGDWLADRDQPISMPSIALPAPVMAFAIEPKAKGDEDKVFTALRRLQEEDPTIDLHRDDADRRADRRRPVADPRRGGRRPAEVALRRRGRR